MTTEIILTYRGGGFLPNIPARDLTADDLARLSADPARLVQDLLDSGLYAANTQTVEVTHGGH